MVLQTPFFSNSACTSFNAHTHSFPSLSLYFAWNTRLLFTRVKNNSSKEKKNPAVPSQTHMPLVQSDGPWCTCAHPVSQNVRYTLASLDRTPVCRPSSRSPSHCGHPAVPLVVLLVPYPHTDLCYLPYYVVEGFEVLSFLDPHHLLLLFERNLFHSS